MAWLLGCVGVVCELDSVFVFFDACFFVLSCFLVGIAWLACGCCLVVVGGWVFLDCFLFGEFDPGSGRTLAACLTHASRTDCFSACWGVVSGERVSNT